jgi:heterodisulfide reductase subunit D
VDVGQGDARADGRHGQRARGWKVWNERLAQAHNEPVLGDVPVSQEHVADWAEG